MIAAQSMLALADQDNYKVVHGQVKINPKSENTWPIGVASKVEEVH